MNVSFTLKGLNFPAGAVWWRVYWLPAPSYWDLAYVLVDGPISNDGAAVNLPDDGGLLLYVWDRDPTGIPADLYPAPIYTNWPGPLKFVARDGAVYTYDFATGGIVEEVPVQVPAAGFPWGKVALGTGVFVALVAMVRRGRK